MNADKVNGWGIVFRFVTPLLVTIGLGVMVDIKSDIREMRTLAKEIALQSVAYNTNHLNHHIEFEKEICERLSGIEAVLKIKK